MRLNKGVNKDIKQQDLPEGMSVDARNIVYDKLSSVGNERGFDFFYDNQDKTIIGVTNHSSGFAILFSVYDNGVSEIGILREENESSSYELIVKDTEALPLFSFNKDYPIKGEIEINILEQIVVAWTETNGDDSINPPRLLNLSSLPFEVNQNKEVTNVEDFQITNIFIVDSQLEIDLLSVEDGGAALSGSYRFSVRYKTPEGDYTSIRYTSPPILISSESNSSPFPYISGDPIEEEPIGNKNISIRVKNLDITYERFQLVYTFTSRGVTESKVIDIDLLIDQEEGSYDFTFVGNENTENILTSQVLVKDTIYTQAHTITQLNRRLYLANLTSSLPEKDFQKYSNGISLKWIQKTVSMDSFEGSYKNPVVSYYDKSFMPGEVYAFYIEYIYKTGLVSPAYILSNRQSEEGELDSTTNLDILNLATDALKFQYEDTSKADGTFGYWQNEDETYPDTDQFDSSSLQGEDLRNTPVRHHKFPSLRALNKFNNLDSFFSLLEGLDSSLSYKVTLKKYGNGTSAPPTEQVVVLDFSNFIVNTDYIEVELLPIEEDYDPDPVQGVTLPKRYIQRFDPTQFKLNVTFLEGLDSDYYVSYNLSSLLTIKAVVGRSTGSVSEFQENVFDIDSFIYGDSSGSLDSAKINVEYLINLNSTSILQHNNGENVSYSQGSFSSPQLIETRNTNEAQFTSSYSSSTVGVGNLVSSGDIFSFGVRLTKSFDQFSTKYNYIRDLKNVFYSINGLQEATPIHYKYPETESESLKLPILGISVEGLALPPSLVNKLEGYKISYANRDLKNRTILAQSLILKSPSPQGAINKDDFVRFHGFEMLDQRVPPSFVKYLEPEIVYNRYNNVYSSLPDNTIIFEDISRDRLTTPLVLNLDTSLSEIVQENNVIQDNKDGTEHYRFKLDLEEDLLEIEGDYIVNAKQIVKNIYAPFDSMSLVRIDKFFKFGELTTSVFRGDTFREQYGIRHSYESANGGIRQSNSCFLPAVFSTSHIGYRSLETSILRDPSSSNGLNRFLDGSYFPKDIINIRPDTFRGTYIGYDITYSDRDTFSSALASTGKEEPLKYPYRVARSINIPNEETELKWDTFLALDYYEMPRDRGVIWNIKGYGETNLLIHTTEMLYTTYSNEVLKQDEISVVLGSSDIFARPPREILSSDKGYAGTTSQFSAHINKLGYTFIDEKRGKIFILRIHQGIKLEEISAFGLKDWYRDNLKLENNYEIKDDNPFAGRGFTMQLDEEEDRLLVTKIDEQGSFTRSFDVPTSKWISFHDYIPSYYLFLNNNLFALNYSKIFKMNSNNSRGVYFPSLQPLEEDGVTLKPFETYVDMVFNSQTSNNKVFYSLSWVSDVLDTNGFPLFNDTISSVWTYNNYQSSVKVDLKRLKNTRRTGGKWTFNEMLDVVSKDSRNNFQNFLKKTTEHVDLDDTKINNNMSWFKKKRFIHNYITVRFTFDNKDNRKLALHEVFANTRNNQLR